MDTENERAVIGHSLKTGLVGKAWIWMSGMQPDIR